MADILDRIILILHNIVQKGCRYAFVTESYVIHHYLGNSYGMKYIRLSGTPSYIFMGIACKLVGALYHFYFFVKPAASPGGNLQFLPSVLYEELVLAIEFCKAHLSDSHLGILILATS